CQLFSHRRGLGAGTIPAGASFTYQDTVRSAIPPRVLIARTVKLFERSFAPRLTRTVIVRDSPPSRWNSSARPTVREPLPFAKRAEIMSGRTAFTRCAISRAVGMRPVFRTVTRISCVAESLAPAGTLVLVALV